MHINCVLEKSDLFIIKAADVLNSIFTAGNMQEVISQNIPLLKLGNKLDIAYAVLYLLTPVASYITGHTMIVDGGDWMTSNHTFSMMTARQSKL